MTTIDASMRALEIQGTTVPKLGFGTWEILGRDCEEAVSDALEIGYRHIDTAQAYDNEAEVGRALAAGDVPRNELFLTTKLWRDEFAPDRVRPSAEGSLERLQVDCVDLLLLHWPNDAVPLEETLGALASLREEGLVMHYGVSNFPAGMLREALEVAPIFADQVEFHPYLGQDALVELAAEKDFMVTAYSPLARGKVPQDEIVPRDRRGARQDRRPGRAAVAARQAERRHHPEGLEPRAARRELRGLRLRAHRRRARGDRRAAQGRARDRPALGARLGRLKLACSHSGAVAEWLRSGLQSRLHRFDSGRRLSSTTRTVRLLRAQGVPAVSRVSLTGSEGSSAPRGAARRRRGSSCMKATACAKRLRGPHRARGTARTAEWLAWVEDCPDGPLRSRCSGERIARRARNDPPRQAIPRRRTAHSATSGPGPALPGPRASVGPRAKPEDIGHSSAPGASWASGSGACRLPPCTPRWPVSAICQRSTMRQPTREGYRPNRGAFLLIVVLLTAVSRSVSSHPGGRCRRFDRPWRHVEAGWKQQGAS